MRTIKLDRHERELEERKTALGYSGHAFVRANGGAHRAAAKQHLLRKIAEAVERRWLPQRFKAKS